MRRDIRNETHIHGIIIRKGVLTHKWKLNAKKYQPKKNKKS